MSAHGESTPGLLRRAAEAGTDLADELPGVLALYRDLHAHPELSGEEHRTRRAVAEALADVDATVHEAAGTGLVVVLRNGPGPVVGMRADTDALPLEEATGLPYASTRAGVMHACGHDVHTAALVGALRHLDRTRTSWSGTVVGIFQPAEETGRGGEAVVAELLPGGALAEVVPTPELVLAQHVTSAPLGRVVCRPGWFLSHQRSWRVTVRGLGGHASRPHLAHDPIVAAASMVGALQTVVSRAVDPFRMAVLTVGTIHGGTKENVIPAEVEMKVSARAYEPEVAATIEATMRRVLEGEAAAHGVAVDVERISDIPACFNDPSLAAAVTASLAPVFGAEHVVAPADPFPAADDFSRYGPGLGVPTLIWNFGVQDAALFEGGAPPPRNHDARFAPHPEHAVALGMLAAVTALRGQLLPGVRPR